MKIAVVDPVINPGGGARTLRALLPAIKTIEPDFDITFFAPHRAIKREKLDSLFLSFGIKIATLKSTLLSGSDLFNIKNSRFIISLWQDRCSKWSKLLPVFLSGAIHRELENRLKGFDLCFFPWPFHMRCPRLPCPMVSLVADFNYKYYFSSNISTPWMTDFLNRHIPDFLKNSTPIVTSQFIAEELSKFYPEYAYKTQIIPLAPLSRSVDENLVKKTLNKFGIRKKFLLYPTNTANHKNIGSLLASLVHICKAGHDVCLVLAGLGTQNINGKACQEGIELNASEQNVFGLGYVTHEEIDALIQSAAVVVNCSLYEGNNGPALDAWAQGVPVAMSRIPVFVELLNTFNVHAALFDPRSPVDIAEKINQLLTDRETTRKKAMDSKISIAEFTWERFARTYVEIFKNSSQCSCAQ